MTAHINDKNLIHQLLKIGALLSNEKDINHLFEIIIQSAMDVTHADGGTVYRLTDDLKLRFELMRTRSKNVHLGGESGREISIPPMSLFNTQGEPELSKVVCYAVNKAEAVNIPDAYNATDFDFSGTRAFDVNNDYRSQSFLTIPMKTLEGEIIGAMQLINATDPETGKIIPFSVEVQEIVEALSSQLAVALTNRLLIDRLQELFESLIKLINQAIDDKSPYTGGHCNRVPELTLMLAEAANKCSAGPLKDFTINDDDRTELRIAGLLHDCGKISTPVHVVDKATKLETIFDRIEFIRLRAEIVRRDTQLSLLKNEITQREAEAHLQSLHEDCAFLEKCNIGSEFMKDPDVERVQAIAEKYQWVNLSGQSTPFLTEDEVKNLTIRAGTLTGAEREIINHHIDMTIAMLEQLPWPRHLKNVPEYAGGHHEKMDGKGYPRGLKREEMSVQARCMGIADIFEALTAVDRPYKKGKTLSEALDILGKMKLGQHVDPDLFDVFVWDRVYEDYAKQFLNSEQIDAIDFEKIPGYQPPPENYYAKVSK